MADGRKYFIQIKADTNLGDVVRALSKVTTGLKSSTKHTALFATKMAMAIKIAKEFGDAMLYAYDASIKFNKGLANVATLIPRQMGRIEELKKGILSLSASTAKPLDDLTNGMYEVISAFEDSAETMERLDVITKASMAGQATTIDALQLLSAVGKGFNDTSAEMLKYISDLSFETVRLGQTNFPQLAHAIQIVTANSTRMGVSMEEMFNVFATMTGVTGNADIVATQLRSALASLADPTDQMKEALQHFGYATGEAMVTAEGFGNAIKKLVEYAPQMGTTVEKLFQRVEAVNLVTALSTNSWDTYIRKLGSLNSATGATNLALAEITDGVNKQGFELEQLQQRYQVFLQMFGQKMQKFTAPAVSALNDLMYKLIGGDVDLANFEQSMQSLIRTQNEYSILTKNLEKAVSDGNTELAENLAIQQALLKVDVLRKTYEMSDAYEDLQKEIVQTNKNIEASKEDMSWTKNTFEDIAKEMGIAIDSGGKWVEKLGDIVHSESLSAEELEKYNDVLEKHRFNRFNIQKEFERYRDTLLGVAEDEATNIEREQKLEAQIKNIASAVNQGIISYDMLGLIQKDLRERIIETSEALKEQNKTIAEGTGGDKTTTRTSLNKEETIQTLKLRVDIAGTSTNALDKLKADYELANREIQYQIEETTEKYKNNAEIRDKLVGLLGEKEQALLEQYNREYEIELHKRELYAQGLKDKLEEEKTEDKLVALEHERQSELESIKGTVKDTAENQKAINAIYDERAKKVRDERTVYTLHLKDQLEELQTEDKLVGIQNERLNAIRELLKSDNASIENLQLIKQIYNEKVKKVQEERALYAQNLQYQLEELKTYDKTVALEHERKNALKELEKSDNNTLKNRRTLNAIYDEKLKKIEEERELYTQNLKYQLEESQTYDKTVALEHERLQALKELEKSDNNSVENQNLINSIYDEKLNKLEEERGLYTQSLDDQLEQIDNTSKLLSLEKERRDALYALEHSDNNSIENQNKLNALYDRKVQLTKFDEETQQSILANQALLATVEPISIFDGSNFDAWKRFQASYNIEVANLQKQIQEATSEFGGQSQAVINLKNQLDKLNEKYDKTSESQVKLIAGAEIAVKAIDDIKNVTNSLTDTIGMFFENSWQLEEEGIREQEEALKAKGGFYEKEEEMLKKLTETRDEQFDALKEAYDADTITKEEYLAQKQAIEDEFNKKKEESDARKAEKEKEIEDKKKALQKKQFEFDKGTRIANAVMDTASGIAKALTLPWPMNLVQAGIVGGLGTAQVVAISQQQMPAYRDGSWEIPQNQVAQLHKGETVLPRKFADDFRNKAKRGFGEGGETIVISNNNFVGVGGVDELIEMMEERKKVLRSRGILD